MRLTLCALLILFLLPSCENNGRGGYGELDLTAYSIPVTIQAPDSATVQSQSLSGVIDDVLIKSPADRYAVQVLASDAATNDMARLKADQLELVRDNRYFARVVEEEPQGFIFENKIDTTSVYGFRYIIYRGDREIVFQNSFDGVFTLPEIESMYASVKPQETK
ncbi:hypothetical protein CLV84_3217 [Neolewinella xylanilytica]|uniref:Uncharacterized protein n=1 Tax=Neolewinella xylanilytica TaxID=1514080 RepID=A0A2S6I541_9BACT|nr:hypothetical protein [Neolewinella xylanilytica]PPK86294.1 hypothetical protein CLV84_3217 [Neolewinella xylanilytica]